MQQIYAYYSLTREEIPVFLQQIVDRGLNIDQFEIVQEIDQADYDDQHGPDVRYVYTLIVVVTGQALPEWDRLTHYARVGEN